MTWSPRRTLVTPGPTSTTTPAPSWPRMAGEKPLRVRSGPGKFVGVTKPGGAHLDQHLACPRPLQLNRSDLQRLARFKCDRSPNVHVALRSDVYELYDTT